MPRHLAGGLSISKVEIGKPSDGGKGRYINPVLRFEWPGEFVGLASGDQSPEYEKTLGRYRTTLTPDELKPGDD